MSRIWKGISWQPRREESFVTTQIANTSYYKSLEQLANSANKWMTWKMKLSHEGVCRALRTLTERSQFLAASLRNSLTTGTLRFRQDASDSPTTSIKCHQGPSSPLLGKKLKRQRKLSSSSSSDEPLVPRTQAHQKTLTATTRMDTPSNPKKGTFRAIALNVSDPAPQFKYPDLQSQLST